MKLLSKSKQYSLKVIAVFIFVFSYCAFIKIIVKLIASDFKTCSSCQMKGNVWMFSTSLITNALYKVLSN
jgi:hypothetical protein